MLIDFSEIPKSNNLFLDFINEFELVKNYYKINFRDESLYKSHFEKIVGRNNPNKEKLFEIINSQYSNFHPSEKTSSNINTLKKPNTIAVFTGQQLGIYGGPLYTIYKIFTVIKLCDYLNEMFSEFNFIPLFWMAGDDHDFEEISYINLINKENELQKIIYNDGIDPFENRGNVGNLKFTKEIMEFSNSIKDALRETEFSNDLFNLTEKILNENISIKDSFFQLLFKIFDETGLVIFNPQDAEVKKLLIPIFKKELLDYKEHTKDLLITSAELDENYHAQVKIKPINLFLQDETGRHLIEPVDDEYRLKGKRKRITQEEILNHLEEKPEDFSANVLLRPICEDYLFPTGFYIAGPGEISYYAQAIPLYKHFNLQHPIIYPRASATILESNIAKILVKYNLSTHDFFIGSEKLKSNLINSFSQNNLVEEFDKVELSLKDIFKSLTDYLGSVDNNLVNVANSSNDKMLHQLNILKDKAAKAFENKYDASFRQISKAQNSIYPNDNLQERELSIVSFLNKYGFDFFDWLYNELDIHDFKHQILEL
ncbi:MAG: bacillithiol biosynthesis cysteine-adding enzyme BshC [Ignavibacteriales bacterium]|nr:bacillithiol biosynthesis cysteine-adding enzyme BshC [Ignavibacteriales bacterium]MCB9218680.1 bacillithiol biosynthesis cysteine-adding enzyme BshC [Ignavibacteriales bacterium]MCB9259314.1 bacillithiol biosynthesis cysteine-adding enzyme BshC [Ignavibacteriales bacterium]